MGSRLLVVLLVGAALGIAGCSAPAGPPAGGAPPWPILFQGEVLLEGEPLAEPGEVTVRMGDWESRPVPVVDGRFTCANPCLIAGPPNRTYIGQPVTFHLNGEYVADLSFEFPELPQPLSETVTLDFSRPSRVWWIAGGGVLAVALVAGVVVGWRVRGGPPREERSSFESLRTNGGGER